ncbi:hypothetical protein L210DRAFT_3503952 [Boletus edulis BED1]|uniref:Uncharacterized protein n=1 Tax=Boletus edulis BED1 TaxID=1328754 RepID=A0AAD4BUG1_BOLED|nr:hypothetical protein L210DRAFT_3503952 [Boletus edulis BED1]
MFSSSTTTFHIANELSLHISVDEAATLFGILYLCAAIWEFLQCMQNSASHPVLGARAQDLHYPFPFDCLQIWYKLLVQELLYHDKKRVDTPQTLRAYPPSPNCPHGFYDAAILSLGSDSHWLQQGIEGHFVAQLRLLFHPINTDSQYLAAYVQRFNIVPQQGISDNIHSETEIFNPPSKIENETQMDESNIAITTLFSDTITKYNTPLALCTNSQLATPLQFCHKVDTYREFMDPKVVEDTTCVHWTLNLNHTKDFLWKLFPNKRLFPWSITTNNGSTNVDMKYILDVMEKLHQRKNNCWAFCSNITDSGEYSEEKVAEFFNIIIRSGKAANNPVEGVTSAIRKPNLILCEEEMIMQRDKGNQKFDIRTDIYAISEVKKRTSKENRKDSYVEFAGKVAFLLEAQDGHYVAPGIQLLGSEVIFTLFDRGGSISTHPLDIHRYPKEFLRILLGITFTDGIILGFDITIFPVKDDYKQIQISRYDKNYIISINTLLFFCGLLHGHSTTVWSSKVTIGSMFENSEVVLKNCWVDPLQKYIEGQILKMLGKAEVKGVPPVGSGSSGLNTKR